MNKLIKKMYTAEFDGFLVQNPVNINYICHKDNIEIPALILVTKENLFIFTQARHYNQIKELYREYTVIKGYLHELNGLCKKLSIKRLAIEADYTTLRVHRLIEHILEMEVIEVIDFIEDLRMIKSDQEMSILKEAVTISDKSYMEFLNYVEVGKSEIELKNIFRHLLYKHGAEDLSFDILLSSGLNTFNPHAKSSHKVIKEGELLMVDFGIKFKGYCTDTTRTMVMKSASDLIYERYQIVLNAQEKVFNEIKAGMSIKELDMIARNYISQRSKSCYEASLGHGIGRMVHEKPRLSKTSKSVLEVNMAIAVEPGIYIEDWGGIRIEDLVIVKEKKAEILTRVDRSLCIIK